MRKPPIRPLCSSPGLPTRAGDGTKSSGDISLPHVSTGQLDRKLAAQAAKVWNRSGDSITVRAHLRGTSWKMCNAAVVWCLISGRRRFVFYEVRSLCLDGLHSDKRSNM